MAKGLCIPTEIVDAIKKALTEGGLAQKLLDAESSEVRHELFGKFVGKELAVFATKGFEKALASNNKKSLIRWMEKLGQPMKGKTTKKGLLERIKQLRDEGFLTPGSLKATLTDTITDMLGIKVSKVQLETMNSMSEKIEELRENVVDEDGLPTKEYFQAIEDMESYIASQAPSPKLKVLFGGIMRTNLLSVSSFVVNQIGNTPQGVMQALERRFSRGQFTGDNADFGWKYIKRDIAIYTATGYGIAREYTGHTKLGEKIMHSEGPGIVRAISRVQQNIVYKWGLGFMDEISASFARQDSARQQATKIAKQEDLTGEARAARSLELFKDSILQEPQTAEGWLIHSQSIADAEAATWTNKSYLSDITLKFRNWMNDATGFLQMGFYHIPFVKTSTNVIKFGIDASVFGFASPIVNFRSAWKQLSDPIRKEAGKKDFEAEAERWAPMNDVIRRSVRAGMGTVLSFMLAALIPPDDFISAYDALTQKERDLRGIKRGVYNAVKIGNTWYSLDFFGALGAPFIGMMYAKKYGTGVLDTAFQYTRGVAGQISQIPGLPDFADLVDTYQVAVKTRDFDKVATKISSDITNSLIGRLIPGILTSAVKAADPKERKMDREDFFAKTKAKLPGLRKTLPAKIDITTGREVESEGFWTALFFGSRKRTANESKLIDEITRLDNVGEAPAIADIERSSKKVQGLRKQVGPKRFQAALKFFGREYGRQATSRIRDNDYRRASDEDKNKMLTKVRSEVRALMLERFNYRAPKKQPRR